MQSHRARSGGHLLEFILARTTWNQALESRGTPTRALIHFDVYCRKEVTVRRMSRLESAPSVSRFRHHRIAKFQYPNVPKPVFAEC